MNKPNITIYTATWCAFCHAAKQYLDSKHITYDDRDVEADPKNAEEAVSKSGQMGIPVLEIDGKVIIGFDKPKIDAALAAAGL